MNRSNIRLQVLGLLPSQHIQHNCVGDQFCVFRVLLQRGGQGGFGLGYAAQMELCDGLADDG